MPVVLSLLAARARHAGARWAMVAATLALAAAIPVVTATLALTTADAALRRGLADLAPGDRSVAVTYNGLYDDQAFHEADRAVLEQLPRLTSAPSRRQMLFRALSDQHGETYMLGAADDLPTAVRLQDGRLPRRCSPTACEVVQLVAPGRATARTLPAGLGVTVVGRVTRTDPYLLSGSWDAGADVPVLLADGVLNAAPLEPLVLRQRTYGWVAPIDLGTLRRQGADGWASTGASVADDLERLNARLVLLAPDSDLRAQLSRAATSSGRFAVLGGSAAVVLLGAAIVGGTALRRDHQAFTSALRRRGADAGTLRLLLAGEVGLAALVGTLLGLALGTAASSALVHDPGPGVSNTVRDALAQSLPAVLALGGGSALLLALTLRVAADGGSPSAGRAVRRTLEASVATLAAVTVLLLARGGVDTSGSRAGDPALAALPVLVLLASGLLAARLWPACAGIAARLLPRRHVAGRIGVAAVAGRPLRPAATAALLTAALGAATFAGAYAATLQRAAADQAAFSVPLDATLESPGGTPRVLDVATPAVLARALPGVAAHAVLHTEGSQRTGANAAEPVRVIGIDPDALPRIQRWDAVVGEGASARELAGRLALPTAAAPGTAVPDGARRLVLDAVGPGPGVELMAHLRDDRGRTSGITLRRRPGTHGQGLVADIDPERTGTGRRLVALGVQETTDAATHTQHALGEAVRGLDAPSGTLALGRLGFVTGAGTTFADEPWRGWEGAGLTVADDGATARLAYAITSGALHLRPGGPVRGLQSPLPALMDGATAATARDGVATVVLDGQPVSLRVAGVLDRFPTIESGRFVVADVASLGVLLDRIRPGAGQPDALWLDRPAGSAPPADGLPADATSTVGQGTVGQGTAGAGGSTPNLPAGGELAGLALRERAVVQAHLRADPVARGATAVLSLGAVLALLVGAAALVLLVVAERRDDAAQTYAWEADGVSPRMLRRSLWWRAVVVAVPSVPFGLTAGLLLASLTARLVAVTATAATPHPPLSATTGGGWGSPADAAALAVPAVVAVLTVLAAALGLSFLVAAAALREPLPVREQAVVS